ncbi:MAG TPA: hypothetical protein VMU26_22015 [Candidatus Polarisedimenticolia bacterium]|nr:hypothetical protein [Candidatus Polarisedimenticolia bacterium]
MKTAIAFLIFGALQLAAQDMQPCPMPKEHMKEASQHRADVEKQGDEAMGFPYDKTTHHFRLYADGGLEVTVNHKPGFSESTGYPIHPEAHCHNVLYRGILHSYVRP